MKNLLIRTWFTVSMVFFGVCSAGAESLFSTAIKVNDAAVTVYELKQRARFLRLLNVPGDADRVAREQLIDDRLKLGAAQILGLTVSEEEIKQGMTEFAARAKIDLPTFIKQIEAQGVSEETFRDFVKSGLLWRVVVQTRFGAQSQVPEAQLERSINLEGSGGGIRVLLSEIILQVVPGQEKKTKKLADELSQISSIKAFADAARRYSVAPTNTSGGKVKWQSLEKLPAVIQPLIFGLAPGDVTDPLPIPNGLALFQLRAIEETNYTRNSKAMIDYLTYQFPASDKAMREQLETEVDQCDDLYALAQSNQDHSLSRATSTLNKIDAAIRDVVAGLDTLEKHFHSLGDTGLFVMVCSRSASAQGSEADLEKIRFGLRNKRLAGYAEGYLENLRQDARIVEK